MTEKPGVGLSVCCGAPLRQHEGEEGTQWFTCSACKRPADAAPDPPGQAERLLASRRAAKTGPRRHYD